MPKFEQEITECLEKFSKYPLVLEKLKAANENEAFEAEVDAWVKQLIEAQKLDGFVEALINGNCDADISDEALFQEAQRIATESLGDWNTETASLAVAAYLTQGGTITLHEALTVTLGEMYGLAEDDPLYKVESIYNSNVLGALEEAAFSGPNRTIPITNFKEAVAALILSDKFSEESKEATLKLADQFSVGLVEGKVALYPIEVQLGESKYRPLVVLSKEELVNIKNAQKSIAEGYQLTTDDQEKLSKYLEQIESLQDAIFDGNVESLYKNEGTFTPVSLDASYLIKWYESVGQENYLRALVGVVGNLKISKETLEEYAKPYRVFDSVVLKSLLNKPVLQEATVDSQEETTIVQKSDPVVDSTEETVLTPKKKSYEPLFKKVSF